MVSVVLGVVHLLMKISYLFVLIFPEVPDSSASPAIGFLTLSGLGIFLGESFSQCLLWIPSGKELISGEQLVVKSKSAQLEYKLTS
jgi:hypothetical protein